MEKKVLIFDITPMGIFLSSEILLFSDLMKMGLKATSLEEIGQDLLLELQDLLGEDLAKDKALYAKDETADFGKIYLA